MTLPISVPSLVITDLIQGQPTDTSQTITITLPLTEYQPEQLVIVSTVEPPDDGPIMADFTSPSVQYTVAFTDLDPATEYTFTIRIVLRSDNTVDVVPRVTGAFAGKTIIVTAVCERCLSRLALWRPMSAYTTKRSCGYHFLSPSPAAPTAPPTQKAPSPVSCSAGCIAGIIAAIVVILMAVIVIFVSVILFKMRKKTAIPNSRLRIPAHFTLERTKQEKKVTVSLD